MTDNDIIKALECCLVLHKCEECPCDFDTNGKTLCNDLGLKILDLINRQKAELEKLKTQLGKRENFFTVKYDEEKLNDIVKSQFEKFEVDIITVRNEAIREFTERLKNAGEQYGAYDSVFEHFIDNLVKEMTEDDNGNNP